MASSASVLNHSGVSCGEVFVDNFKFHFVETTRRLLRSVNSSLMQFEKKWRALRTCLPHVTKHGCFVVLHSRWPCSPPVKQRRISHVTRTGSELTKRCIKTTASTYHQHHHHHHHHRRRRRRRWFRFGAYENWQWQLELVSLQLITLRVLRAINLKMVISSRQPTWYANFHAISKLYSAGVHFIENMWFFVTLIFDHLISRVTLAVHQVWTFEAFQSWYSKRRRIGDTREQTDRHTDRRSSLQNKAALSEKNRLRNTARPVCITDFLLYLCTVNVSYSSNWNNIQLSNKL